MTTLAELKELIVEATPGEWNRCCNYIRSSHDDLMIVSASPNNSWSNETENLDLIAACQRSLPSLIAIAEAAQEVFKEWDEECEPWPPDYQRLGEALKGLK